MNTKKHIHFFSLYLLLAVPFLFIVSSAFAVDASYYSTLNNQSGSNLRSKLTVLLYSKHTLFDKYGGSGTENWDFPFDYDSNGYVWDIYTRGCQMTITLGSGNTCCCDGMNREHIVCQSSFGGSDNMDKIPQYCDRHHLYLVDAHTNSFRNNYAFGECHTSADASHGSCKNSSTHLPSETNTTCANHSLGWLGTATTYADLYKSESKVYEPDDEFKGDIARAILYMVVRYAEQQYCRLPDGAQYCTASGGGAVKSSLTTANQYPCTAWSNTADSTKVGRMFSTSLSTNFGLSAYGKAILLKWHRQDPVSQKEIDRNAGVEAVQGNRNPFVDYPCLVEYLWGNKTGETFNTSNVVGSFESTFTPESSDGCSCSTEPAITLPNEDVAFGSTNTSTPLNQVVTVRGVNLENGNLTVSLTGTNANQFSISANSISKANAESGYSLTITYSPNAIGNHTATLQISGCGVTTPHEITLTGTCAALYTITWSANGSTVATNTAADGARPTIPSTPGNCNASRVFMGWTATSGYTHATAAPTDLFTTTAPTVNSDKTFYAVYATASTSGGGSSNDYALFSGELEEGNYVLYYNGYALNARVASKRFTYQTVTPSDNKISNPSDSIIWHIAQDEDYWTLYNEKTGAYAGATSTKNQGALLADITDYALWSCDATSSTTTYDFINKGRAEGSTDTGNKYLRNNGTNGFAAYAYATGGALSLYKQTVNVTYVEYSTTCTAGNQVTVTFHANGGEGSMPSQSVPENVSVPLSTNTFVRACHTFAGWATSAEGSKVYDDGQSITINSNTNLYALWTANPVYTVTFTDNGSTHATRSGCAGETMEAVADPTPCEGYTFEGWSTYTYVVDNTETPSLTTPTTIPEGGATYYAVYTRTEGGNSTVIDTLNYALIGGGKNYTSWTDKTSHSDAVYAGLSAGGTDASGSCIQLRTTNSNEGIVATTSGGKATKLTLIWNSATSAARTLYVYGKNSAYTAASELFASETKGTLLGTLTTSDSGLTISGDYEYIGFCSSSGALYLDEVTISWSVSNGATYHTTSPSCTPCTHTVTATSEDEAKGTAAVALP